MVVAMRPGSTAPERGGDGQDAEVTGLAEGWHHGTSQREHMPWQGSRKGVALRALSLRETPQGTFTKH